MIFCFLYTSIPEMLIVRNQKSTSIISYFKSAIKRRSSKTKETRITGYHLYSMYTDVTIIVHMRQKYIIVAIPYPVTNDDFLYSVICSIKLLLVRLASINLIIIIFTFSILIHNIVVNTRKSLLFFRINLCLLIHLFTVTSHLSADISIQH